MVVDALPLFVIFTERLGVLICLTHSKSLGVNYHAHGQFYALVEPSAKFKANT
jgi:hypothetical protein